MADQVTNATRPASHLIRFDRDCFEQDGERVEYVVHRSALHSGPAVFNERSMAESFARATGRAVTERRSPRLVRVKWC